MDRLPFAYAALSRSRWTTRPRGLLAATAALLGAVWLTGCGHDGAGAGDPPDPDADSIAWTSLDLSPDVLAPAADSAVVVARVLDSSGEPVEGATVGVGLMRPPRSEDPVKRRTDAGGIVRLAIDAVGVGGVVFHTTEALTEEDRTSRVLLLEPGVVTRVTIRLAAEDGERVAFSARSDGRAARFGQAMGWAIEAPYEARMARRNQPSRVTERVSVPAVDSIRDALEFETDPEVRALLWTGLLYTARVVDQPVPRATAERALAELDNPRAWAWWLIAAAPRVLEYAAAGAAGAFRDGEVVDSAWDEGTRYASAFVQRIVEEHPDPWIRSGVLMTAMDWAGDDGRGADALQYYDRLVAEYPGSYQLEQAEWTKRELNLAGGPVPDVPLSPLDTAAAPIRPADLDARAVLIDFWATWCTPCVEEMPTLHAAHREWAGRGLEIVSVSYDDTRAEVHAFRRVWPMPWLHGFEGRGAAVNGEVWEAYAIGGLPHTVLIDESGRIVETGEALKGDRLEETLRRVLAER